MSLRLWWLQDAATRMLLDLYLESWTVDTVPAASVDRWLAAAGLW